MADRDYYNIYYPYEKVQVKRRFFFFSTLFDKPDNTGAVYLGNLARKAMFEGMEDNNIETNSDGDSIIVQALKFLKRVEEFERNQERDFFEQHLKSNPNLPEKMNKELEKIISEKDNIDYYKFIALINVFFKDLDSFQRRLNYETKRLEEYNKVLQKFKAELLAHKRKFKNKYGKKNGETSDEQLFYMFNNYVMDLKASGLKESEAYRIVNTQTLTSRISTSLRRIYEEVWDNTNWRDKMLDYCKRKGIKAIANEIELQKGFTFILLQEFLEKAEPRILEEIQQYSKSEGENSKLKKGISELLSKNLATDFVDSLTQYENGEYGADRYLIISNLINSLGDGEKILAEIEDVYKHAFKQLGEVKGTTKDEKHKRASLSGLSKETIAFLEKWLSKQKGSNFKIKENINWQQRKNELIKALASHLNISIVQEENKNRKDYRELGKAINGIIDKYCDPTIRLSEKNPLLSEFAAGRVEGATLFDAFKIGFTNPSAKADNTFIEIGKIEFMNRIDFDRIAQEITDNYYETLNKRTLSITIDGKTITETDFRKQNKIKTNEYSIEAETLRRIDSLTKLYDEIKAQLKESGYSAKQIRDALKQLENSFVIDTSVKNYDKLDNDRGFHGGSIGGSVEQQVKNILKMFSWGGITPPDKDWLIFSVYNSGPGLVLNDDPSFQSNLEDLFSTVAVMLLFEDSGEQAQYIMKQVEKRRKRSPKRRFLHLYNLNGVFFPQSYILNLTYNGLAEAYGILQSTTKQISDGSRANIINPVSVKNMVGKDAEYKKMVNGKEKTVLKYKQVVSKKNWTDTFKKNKGSVSIQITFLAGFLDILEEIKNAMTELLKP